MSREALADKFVWNEICYQGLEFYREGTLYPLFIECYLAGYDARQIEIAKLTAQLKKAEDVIEFYADGNLYSEQLTVYEDYFVSIDDSDHIEVNKGFKTGGKLARYYLTTRDKTSQDG